MIYYLEDDTSIRELVLYALASAGLEAEGFAEPGAFRRAVEQAVPDLVLLDIMLPTEDGLSVLTWLRSRPATKVVPVMMLTAKGTEYDKVLGLDSGADDYLAKPFGMMELVSRCNALLRRAGTPRTTVQQAIALQVGDLAISPEEHRAFAGGVELELTLKEYELLATLISAPGRAFSRPQLLEHIWGITYMGETRTVDTHIQTLRRKIDTACPGAGDAIETVRGVGYRLAKEIK